MPTSFSLYTWDLSGYIIITTNATQDAQNTPGAEPTCLFPTHPE